MDVIIQEFQPYEVKPEKPERKSKAEKIQDAIETVGDVLEMGEEILDDIHGIHNQQMMDEMVDIIQDHNHIGGTDPFDMDPFPGFNY